MEQQEPQPKKQFEPLEKARLAMRLVNSPDFEREIDEYVDGQDYDEQSVNFFKYQIAIQQKLQQEGGKLLDTGGQIASLVMGAFAKSWQNVDTKK